MKPKYPEIGKRLVELRKNKGLTQSECLEGLGDITIQMISSWENGHAFPRVDYLIKIAQFYNVSLDYVVMGIKKDDLYKKPTNYLEVVNNLFSLIDSNLFNHSSSHEGNNKQDLYLITRDKIIVEFYDKLTRLNATKDLYGEIAYQKALNEIINSCNKRIPNN